MQTFPHQSPSWIKDPTTQSLMFFGFTIFLYCMGDALLAFMAPNIIESYVNNTFLMGIIFSTSSLVGYTVDLLLGNFFKERTFFTYLLAGICIAILAPLLLLLFPPSVVIFIAAMATWGIYFELINFAKSNFVHHKLTHDKHDLGWATINAFSNVAYLIGPSAAILLLAIGIRIPLIVALAVQVVALIAVIIYKKTFGDAVMHLPNRLAKPNLWLGMRTWKIVNRKLWPILLFLFSMILFDATFYTIGSILVVSQREAHPIVMLLFAAYILPSLLVAPIGVKLGKHWGKKRTAFVTGLLGSVAYVSVALTKDFTLFVCLIGVGSMGISIAFQEIRGAIEDYCERLGESGNSVVGLTSSMGSLAYIVGPIIGGAAASLVGEINTFALMGSIIAVSSVIALIVIPRKVRLPQKEIQELYQQ